jgi:hypothetical protein
MACSGTVLLTYIHTYIRVCVWSPHNYWPRTAKLCDQKFRFAKFIGYLPWHRTLNFRFAFVLVYASPLRPISRFLFTARNILLLLSIDSTAPLLSSKSPDFILPRANAILWSWTTSVTMSHLFVYWDLKIESWGEIFFLVLYPKCKNKHYKFNRLSV